jgi:hypothetical protein
MAIEVGDRDGCRRALTSQIYGADRETEIYGADRETEIYGADRETEIYGADNWAMIETAQSPGGSRDVVTGDDDRDGDGEIEKK